MISIQREHTSYMHIVLRYALLQIALKIIVIYVSSTQSKVVTAES